MKILVSSSFGTPEPSSETPNVFLRNKGQEVLLRDDVSKQSIEFRVDGAGTEAYFNGSKLSIPTPFSKIRNTSQMRMVLNMHEFSLTTTGKVEFQIRASSTILDPEHDKPGIETMSATGPSGCAGAGCASAGCTTVGCAGAGCVTVGCAGAGCAAAGKGVGGCATVACAAVACGAAGCAAAACGAVGCGLAGCATVACGAADGECGAAACALDAFCAANAGWPP